MPLLILAGFSVVALLFSGQVWLDHAYNDFPISWARALLYSAFDWYSWAALTPLIVRLSRRFRFTRSSWKRALLVHGFTCLIVVCAKSLATDLFILTVGGPDRPSGSSLGLYFGILTYWLLLGLSLEFERFGERREREKRAAELESELARARLESLRTRLQPHFLFNALNGIAGLMREDVEAADKMLTQLSDLLRMTLSSAEREQVSLTEELEVVEAYLGIQQVRFGARMVVSRDIDPSTRQLLVPVMSLQPLVENAVEHAVETTPGTVHIRISSRREGDSLIVEIEDDGPGPLPTSTEGTGLATTRSRLAHLHGTAANLELDPAPGGGARVTLTLPVQRMEDPEHAPPRSHRR